MFTQRNSSQFATATPLSINPTTGSAPPVNAVTDNREKSVIGNDLKIVGQGLKIISQGILQVDGEIEGDVQGAEVIVGAKGKVTGIVTGQKVEVYGNVTGVVCGNMVILKSSSTVSGDINHMSLGIERGAQFDGSSHRAATETDLMALPKARTPSSSR